ncbi:MAG: DUF6311 domain-containing protein [Gemmiger sp.]|nr:DUF6311 domain-containing protein [Gemmiger sp.]
MAMQRSGATNKQSPRPATLFLVGGLLGLVAFLLVYGILPLDVTNDAFCRGGYIEKDIQQHYAGWLFYRQSALSFPLGVAQGINAPAGLSVAYTDSIPLVAAVLRLLSPLLPGTFQYFGWFTLVCFFLQGGFGALLLSLFTKGIAAPLLGDVLLVASPILWERAFRHTSLGAQFLVLGVLYYYFRAGREGRYAYPGLFLLNVLAIGIHPYFLPMTFAVTLALLVRHALRQRRWRGPLVFLVGNLGATAALGGVLGLFWGKAGGGSEALYGYFSLNLNALWNPVGVGNVLWSRVLPAQNQVGGNYDAFAYLGLGVLVALAGIALYTLLWRRRAAARLLASHLPLCVVCLILTVFAVTNTVTANGATLFSLPLPGWLVKLCSVFRSSGRMIWPVYYLLVLIAIVGCFRLAGRAKWRWAGIAALGILAAAQLWDVSPGLVQRRAAMKAAYAAPAYPTALTSSFWAAAAGQYTHLQSVAGPQRDALHLALYAADSGMTTNDPFAARYDSEALAAAEDTTLAELQSGVLHSDTLYVFYDEGDFLQAVEAVKADAWCGHIRADSGEDTAAEGWYVIAPGLAGYTPDALATPYDDAYPLRLANYTDQLWNRGVLDSDKKTVCFKDSPFARTRLADATALVADGKRYAITKFDDHDPGWLMLTLDIDDATILWDKELEMIKP